MDRGCYWRCEGRWGFPHARGDGPHVSAYGVVANPFSPRTWGWTAGAVAAVPPAHVFPTHVGMDRRKEEHGEDARGFPHARGDGPLASGGAYSTAAFSPRTWGWTDLET